MSSYTFTPPKASDIERAYNMACFAAKEQIYNDCQKYCKYDQGTMKDTATSFVHDMSIECRWNQPYSIYAWYTGHPSHAGTYLQWAEHAETVHGKEWTEILSKGLNDNL